MEKLLLLVGLCFLFFGFSGFFACGLGFDRAATIFLEVSWVCLVVVVAYIFKVVLLA